MFIEAFWKHRDPTPNSPENEFKTEHYKRIAYANRYLGRDAPRPGWRTDRGRIHIILGEPNDITNYENKAGVYDAVICSTGQDRPGTPGGLQHRFLPGKRTGGIPPLQSHEPRPPSASPGPHGQPDRLPGGLRKAVRDRPDAGQRFDLPDSGRGGRFRRPAVPLLRPPHLARHVQSARLGRERYARKFLEYKDRVEVEYTANYMDSDALFKVFREPQTG